MYNHTGIQGRLTATPELRKSSGGISITSFTIASDTGRKDHNGDKIVNFIDCVAWRTTAEFAAKYLTKGRLVLVEGELSSRTYEAKDGSRRKATEITVDSIHFCDSRNGQSGAGQGYGEPTPPAGSDPGGGEESDSDDYPF